MGWGGVGWVGWGIDVHVQVTFMHMYIQMTLALRHRHGVGDGVKGGFHRTLRLNAKARDMCFLGNTSRGGGRMARKTS